MFTGSLWCFQPSSSLQALWRCERPSLNCTVYGAIAFPSQTIAGFIVLRGKKPTKKKELKVLVMFMWPLIPAWMCFLGWYLTPFPLCIFSGCPSHESSIYLYHSGCRKDYLESENTFFTTVIKIIIFNSIQLSGKKKKF